MQKKLDNIRDAIAAAKAAPVYAPLQRLQHAERALDVAVELLQIMVDKLEARKK